jgi:hypothetical protein
MVIIKSSFNKFASLRLHHDDPEVFYKSQWQSNRKSLIFLIYKWILAAFFIGIVCYSWTKNIINETFAYWFIYMTSWGILLCAVTATFSAILTTLHHIDPVEKNPKSTGYKVYWFLSYVSTVLAFLITIVYWSLLFDGMIN